VGLLVLKDGEVAMVQLRNFLFLDTGALTDYLSTLQGSVIEGSVDQTEVGKRDRGGKIGATVYGVGLEAGLSSGSSTEMKQKLSIPDAARFQQLYSLLGQEDAIQELDAFDEEIWGQLRRREILEVQANIRLSEAFTTLRLAENAMPLLGVMDAFGLEAFPDPKVKQQFEAMRKMGKLTDEKPIPLLFEAIGTPDFGFVAHLASQYLRCGLSELQGEATVFGTIQRIIPLGQQQEVFNILPAVPNTTMAQRQQVSRDLASNGLAEVIKGPAILLTPLAIYR
jgi:hypothetical protein